VSNRYWSLVRGIRDRIRLPGAALAELRREQAGDQGRDSGADKALPELIN
jgi:hypothetical protein